MEYTKLGRTGLDVSRICLGCMSYGGGNLGNHAWSLPEDESRPFIKKALEAGINFFDTANRYSLGNSEEILGRAIKDFARRDEVVIATKVYGRMRPGPYGAGLSRKAITPGALHNRAILRSAARSALMVDPNFGSWSRIASPCEVAVRLLRAGSGGL